MLYSNRCEGKDAFIQDAFQTGIMSDLNAVKNKDYWEKNKPSQKHKLSSSGVL